MLLRPRWLLPVVVAGPVALASLLGLAHPLFLTEQTAQRWRDLHLVLLPLIPLFGTSIWLLLLGRRGAWPWVARLLGAAFALLYTTLDSIAGIGAGAQTVAAARRGAPRPPVDDLFGAGDPLGHAGVVALAAGFVVTAVLLRERPLPAAAGGVLSTASCWLLLRHHVFPPLGVLGGLGIAAGLAVLSLAANGAAGPRAGTRPLVPPREAVRP